jgi:hypothetical protein
MSVPICRNKKATNSYEKSAYFFQTTRRHVPNDKKTISKYNPQNFAVSLEEWCFTKEFNYG